MDHFSKNQIEIIAYRLWEEAGRPESDGVEFWLRAESIYLENSFINKDLPIGRVVYESGYIFVNKDTSSETESILKRYAYRIL